VIRKYKLFFLGFFFLGMVLDQGVLAANLSIHDFIGETLTYKVTWLGVPAGTAELQVIEDQYEGQPVIKILGKIRSARWFSLVYKVQDDIESILDPVTLKPLKLTVDIREGDDYKRKSQYTFDYNAGKMYTTEKKRKDLDLPEEFLELFGMFYLLRMTEFSKGEPLSKTVVDGRRFYQVEARQTGKEVVPSRFGNHECLVIEPSHVRLENVGIRDEAEAVSIYLTNDASRLPVMARGKLRIGSLVGVLTSVG